MGGQIKTAEQHAAPTDPGSASVTPILSDALGALGQGYAIFDSDLCLAASNERFGEIMGFPAELQQKGTPLEAILRFRAERGDYGPEDREVAVRQHMALAMRNRRRKLEHLLPDGRIVEALSTPMAGGGFVTLFTDVSERRTAELQRVASEERAAAALQALWDAIDSLPEGFALYDRNDRLVVCNERFREMLPYCADILVPGTDYSDVLDRLAEVEAVKDANVDAEQWREERLEMRRQGGGSFQYKTDNDRWIRALDRRTADGGMVSIRMDITKLKEREQEFAESEERTAAAWRTMADAIESMGEGFAIFDADDRLVTCNDSLRRLLPSQAHMFRPGVSYMEVLDDMLARGRFEDAIGREEEWKAERLHYRSALREPYEYRLDDGRWLRALDRPTTDGGTVAIRLDVTEEHTRERELREQTELLEATLASLGQGIMVVGSDLRLRAVNERALELLNLPKDLARAGTHMETLVRYGAARGDFGEGDVEALINERLTMFVSPDPDCYEERRPNGRHLEIRRNPMPGGGSVSTYTDVTAQAEAEARLRESEERYRRLFESAPETILVHDDERVLYSNPAGAKLFRASDPADLTGRTLEELTDPEWYAQIRGLIPRVISGEIAPPPGPGRLRALDGAMIDIEITCHSFEMDGRAAVQSIIRDVTERKRAEEALRQSQAAAAAAQQTLIEAIDSLSEGFALFDADDRLVICNDRYRAYYPNTASMIEPGVAFEALVRHGAAQREYAEAVGREEEWIEERLAQHRYPPEAPFEQHFSDGRCLRVMESRTPSGGVAGLRVDITEQKRAEAKLRESEEQHRQFLEHTPEAIVVHDGTQILYCNLAGAALLAVDDPAEVNGRNIFDFIHEDWQEPARELVPRLLAGEIELPRSEWQLLAADGRVIEAEVHARQFDYGGRAALQNIIRDIGPQKEAEARLRESEERHRGLVEQLPDGVIVHDGYNIRYGNPVAVEMLGAQSVEDLQSRTLEDITPPEVWPDVKVYIEEGLARGESSPLVEAVMIRLDGQPVDVELVGQPFDHQGQRYAQMVVRDITEHKRVAAEQRRLEEELRQAQKMEAVGTLAGGIAHDFNNVLGAMLGYAELTLDDVPEESLAAENLGHILGAGRRAQELVGQILAFSRREYTAVGPVRLADVVDEVMGLLRPSIPKSIEIDLLIEAPDAVVEGRAGQIHQVLMNLCTNAAQALGTRPGRLSMSLTPHRQDRPEETTTGPLYPGDYFVVEVADTGEGMEASVAARMFEPFYTTKDVGEGTGMGLAVVHGIVGDHGGRVAVQSAPGEGTSVRVYLPCSGGRAVAAEEVPRLPAPGEGRILVVDDEAIIADMTGKMLSRLGYQPECVTNALEALTIMRQRIHDFDLILTDQTMPNVTGDMIIDEAHRLAPGLPVILCSGYGRALSTREAAEIGASAFLSKPFKPAELSDLVQQVLRQTGPGGESS